MAISIFMMCGILCALTTAGLANQPSNQELMPIIQKLSDKMATMEKDRSEELMQVKELKQVITKLTERIVNLENDRKEELTKVNELKQVNERLTERIVNLEQVRNEELMQVKELKQVSEELMRDNENLKERMKKVERSCTIHGRAVDYKAAKVLFSETEKGVSVESNVHDDDRRVRSDDINSLEPVVSQLSTHVTQMEAEIQVLKNGISQQGASYVRWGNRQCPGDAQLVYSGDIGGSHYTYSGAAVDYLCLPKNPVFDNHPIPNVIAGNNHQQLFGSEYEPFEANHDLEAVCAVCRSTRSSNIMVPATTSCPAGWTMEYGGYLMAGSITHAAASQFVCVDHSEQIEQGTNRDDNGKLLYYTVTRCGSLDCPPYINDKIVSCVVCSK